MSQKNDQLFTKLLNGEFKVAKQKGFDFVTGFSSDQYYEDYIDFMTRKVQRTRDKENLSFDFDNIENEVDLVFDIIEKKQTPGFTQLEKNFFREVSRSIRTRDIGKIFFPPFDALLKKDSEIGREITLHFSNLIFDYEPQSYLGVIDLLLNTENLDIAGEVWALHKREWFPEDYTLDVPTSFGSSMSNASLWLKTEWGKEAILEMFLTDSYIHQDDHFSLRWKGEMAQLHLDNLDRILEMYSDRMDFYNPTAIVRDILLYCRENADPQFFKEKLPKIFEWFEKEEIDTSVTHVLLAKLFPSNPIAEIENIQVFHDFYKEKNPKVFEKIWGIPKNKVLTYEDVQQIVINIDDNGSRQRQTKIEQLNSSKNKYTVQFLNEMLISFSNEPSEKKQDNIGLLFQILQTKLETNNFPEFSQYKEEIEKNLENFSFKLFASHIDAPSGLGFLSHFVKNHQLYQNYLFEHPSASRAMTVSHFLTQNIYDVIPPTKEGLVKRMEHLHPKQEIDELYFRIEAMQAPYSINIADTLTKTNISSMKVAFESFSDSKSEHFQMVFNHLQFLKNAENTPNNLQIPIDSELSL